jgi:hypothetical protein
MLFKFGKLWKSVIFILSSWGLYLIFDFEFTVITLLSLIIIANLDDSDLLV